MDIDERDEMIARLREKLSHCEARFEAEARKRGFDPAQVENLALPATLAELFTECQEIRTELEEIAEQNAGG